MALEPIGNSIAVDKLKKRLKKRYPNHNFDVKQQPDTRHKAPSLCEETRLTIEMLKVIYIVGKDISYNMKIIRLVMNGELVEH